MGKEARVSSLSRVQGKDIVADDALEPLHPIVAGDAHFAPVREVGESDGFADGPIFAEHVSIVSRHLTIGNLLEGGLQFGVVVV
jgi:hypothetical protein